MKNPKWDTLVASAVIATFFTLIVSIARTENRNWFSFLGNIVVWFPFVLACVSLVFVGSVMMLIVQSMFAEDGSKLNLYREIFRSGILLALTSATMFVGNVFIFTPLFSQILKGAGIASVVYALTIPLLSFVMFRILRILILHLTHTLRSMKGFAVIAMTSLAIMVLFPSLVLIEKFAWSIFFPTIAGVLLFAVYLILFVTRKPKRSQQKDLP